MDYREVRSREIRGVKGFEPQILSALRNMERAVKPDGYVVLVLGETTRGGRTVDVADKVRQLVAEQVPTLQLREEHKECLRSRHSSRPDRREATAVYQCAKEEEL